MKKFVKGLRDKVSGIKANVKRGVASFKASLSAFIVRVKRIPLIGGLLGLLLDLCYLLFIGFLIALSIVIGVVGFVLMAVLGLWYFGFVFAAVVSLPYLLIMGWGTLGILPTIGYLLLDFLALAIIFRLHFNY